MSRPGPVFALNRRSRTGIPGIGIAQVTIWRRKVPHYVAHVGRRSRKFNIERLGKDEALRRALRVRAAYEKGAV